ncbi:MAG: hypothetical protein J0L94_16390 [Rhodothermia bacterium]|nr:hypothetical protein [Rhodothermia bacterium]
MKTTILFFVLTLFCAVTTFSQPTFSKQVRFAKGANSATAKGTLLNVEGIHTYMFRAKGGQRLQVKLKTTSSKVGFLVMQGDEDGTILLDEGTGAQTIDLPENGTYKVVVQGLGVMGVSMIKNVKYTLQITII